MKKVLYILLSLFLFRFGIVNVNAETITLEQVINNWGENLKNAYRNFAGEAIDELNVKYFAEIIGNEIIVKQNVNDEVQTLATLNVNNDIISHNYVYNGIDVSVEMLKNSYLYTSLIVTVGRLHGYTDNDLDNVFANISTAKFEDVGYELKSDNENNVQTSYFRIDINKFNLKNSSEMNNNTNDNIIDNEIDNSNENDTPIDNPKTGMFNPIVVCSILAVNGILLISIINKKNIIRKI